MNTSQRLETLALHAGHNPQGDRTSRAVPIYQTASYVFDDADHAARLFALQEMGQIYTRIGNPTTDVLEQRLAALHGGAAAVAASSGMAAIFNAIATIASQGQNFICSKNLYGGSWTMFVHTLGRFGIEARFVDASDAGAVESLIDDKTRLVYTESVGNPRGNVDDIAALAAVAHRHNLPFIIDNTFTPPPIFNPFEHGADIIVYSLTKMIGGHGVSIGGAVVEKGDFDWKSSGKFPEISEPDLSYHGVNFWDAFGNHPKAVAPGMAFSLKVRTGILRNVGAALSPFNSWTFLQGIETLPLRANRHCENASALAAWLETHPLVEWVEYAGLASHPDYARARLYMPLGPGAVFCFGVKGGYEAGKRFIDSLTLVANVANVLDAKSMVVHPASTTHAQLSVEEKHVAGIRPEMIRFSVGLENVEDIKADFEQALQAATK